MKYLPYGGDAVLNIGVEEGPDAVLSEVFVASLETQGKCDHLDFTYSEPEAVPDDAYYSVFSKETDTLARQIVEKLKSGRYSHLVTVGGDHGIGLASTLAVLRFHKDKKVGLIDFDSHGDIHLLGTSPSGNFHGMWLRPLFDGFDEPHVAGIVDVSLSPSQCMYIGNMILEEEERSFIEKNDIAVINSNDITEGQTAVQERIKKFCESVDVLHVTFDIDVFKKDLVASTGTPNPDGFDEAMIGVCMEPIVASQKLFSLDVVEVNPKKGDPENTIRLAQEVISKFVL